MMHKFEVMYCTGVLTRNSKTFVFVFMVYLFISVGYLKHKSSVCLYRVYLYVSSKSTKTSTVCFH